MNSYAFTLLYSYIYIFATFCFSSDCPQKPQKGRVHCCDCSLTYGLMLYTSNECSKSGCTNDQTLCDNLCSKSIVVQEGDTNTFTCSLCDPGLAFCQHPNVTYKNYNFSPTKSTKLYGTGADFDIQFPAEPECTSSTALKCIYQVNPDTTYVADKHVCICAYSVTDKIEVISQWENDKWNIRVNWGSKRDLQDMEISQCKYKTSWEIVDSTYMVQKMTSLSPPGCLSNCTAELGFVNRHLIRPKDSLKLRATESNAAVKTTGKSSTKISFRMSDTLVPSMAPVMKTVMGDMIVLEIYSPMAQGWLTFGMYPFPCPLNLNRGLNYFQNYSKTFVSSYSQAVEDSCTCIAEIIIDKLYANSEYSLLLTYSIQMSNKPSSLFNMTFKTPDCTNASILCSYPPQSSRVVNTSLKWTFTLIGVAVFLVALFVLGSTCFFRKYYKRFLHPSFGPDRYHVEEVALPVPQNSHQYTSINQPHGLNIDHIETWYNEPHYHDPLMVETYTNSLDREHHDGVDDVERFDDGYMISPPLPLTPVPDQPPPFHHTPSHPSNQSSVQYQRYQSHLSNQHQQAQARYTDAPTWGTEDDEEDEDEANCLHEYGIPVSQNTTQVIETSLDAHDVPLLANDEAITPNAQPVLGPDDYGYSENIFINEF